ncbi:hypothetical protein V8E54_009229 [Elaphomyces granulatus]
MIHCHSSDPTPFIFITFHPPSFTPPSSSLPDLSKNVFDESSGGPIYKAFTFENDNTGTADDAVDLKSCFRDIFGLTDITKVLLKSSDKSPGWTLMKTRSLLILAYIGHGVIDPVNDPVEADFLPGSIDRLAIFDCCYAGGAIRSTSETTSKVIAACGKNEIARIRHVDSVSFTQRLCCAIRSLPSPFLALAELQRKKPQGAPSPLHLSITGVKPLVLATRNKHPSPIKSTLLDLSRCSSLWNFQFQETLITTRYLQHFEIVKNLPPVSIIDAYKSSSVLFILRGSWETFLRFSNVIGLSTPYRGSHRAIVAHSILSKNTAWPFWAVK